MFGDEEGRSTRAVRSTSDCGSSARSDRASASGPAGLKPDACFRHIMSTSTFLLVTVDLLVAILFHGDTPFLIQQPWQTLSAGLQTLCRTSRSIPPLTEPYSKTALLEGSLRHRSVEMRGYTRNSRSQRLGIQESTGPECSAGLRVRCFSGWQAGRLPAFPAAVRESASTAVCECSSGA